MSTEAPALIHPTYRYLDRTVRLAGLTISQWSQLVGAGVSAWVLAQVLPFSSTYDLSIALTIAGTPVAASLATGAEGVHPLAHVRAVIAWRRRAAVYLPGVGPTAAPHGYRLLADGPSEATVATRAWTSVEELWD